MIGQPVSARVPKVGLEPTPPCGDRILSPAHSKPPGKRKFKAAKCLTSIQSHKDLPVDPPVIHDTCQNAPDLAAVMAAWPELPEAVRAGILAMVQAATGGAEKPRGTRD
jgi:hypothetical protein